MGRGKLCAFLFMFLVSVSFLSEFSEDYCLRDFLVGMHKSCNSIEETKGWVVPVNEREWEMMKV